MDLWEFKVRLVYIGNSIADTVSLKKRKKKKKNLNANSLEKCQANKKKHKVGDGQSVELAKRMASGQTLIRCSR
jgi:hypothetical protein